MLDLRLTHDDISPTSTWQWAGSRWRCGSSWISPYRHQLTEQASLTDGIRTAFIAAARKAHTSPTRPDPVAVSPGTYDRRLRELRGSRDDWTTVELGPGQSVRVRTGTACTAPQYLAVADRVLYGSWDLLNLRDHQATDRLDPVAVTRMISLRNRYSASTLWQDIKLLTERATAHFPTDGQLLLQFPEPAEHSRARALQEDADPVPLFQDLLDRAVARLPWSGSRTAVQLSAGMDSTTVALALRAAPQGTALTAGTVLLDGVRGIQQNERRRMILEHVASGWTGITVNAMDHLPYAGPSRFSRAGWVSPTSDIYLDALETLSARFADSGVRAVFTGIGGDELMAVTAAEDTSGPGAFEPDAPPWLGPAARAALADVDSAITPAAIVPETALMAKTVCGPALMRRGMWPIHPLTDPLLVRFCEWLPMEWRRRKHLLRVLVDRTGMPGQVARPPIVENFHHVIDTAMRHHGAPRIRRILNEGSPLIEAGLLDPDGLARVAGRLEAGSPAGDDHEAVFALLADSALTIR
ncbi:asparagine synthase-related protein [Kitasatospora sp. CM 4170]|uniref:Asparagine synthase-related protein n=1 Tax=Kitasatospora aburaviensis TaxID=67265 RepID=A0ABW1EPN9_9ACTN|nr:asparagine synthase-related protein [Kitasatospora sp. CM 4170]WNM45317.1 asparagine synthase-related protein [Kitasatospora sp. CM 4170]